MLIHFPTRAMAEAHLKTNGFVFSRKRWAAKAVRASIHPTTTEVVSVCFWSVGR